MKCIDAIEGNVKKIISRIHDVSVEQQIEDSEFIRNVKVVLAATVEFLDENREITDAPELLHDILLEHARNKWINGALAAAPDSTDPQPDASEAPQSEYLAYYFDTLYKSGNFPL